jgi:uncharacterized protein (UPF0332 family)
MYFSTVALLLTRNVRLRTHTRPHCPLGQEFVDTGIIKRHYGRALRIAEELRSEVDYSISREISEEEACEIIKDAKEFLRE